MLRKLYPFFIGAAALVGLAGASQAHAHVYPDQWTQTRYLSTVDTQLTALPGVAEYRFDSGTRALHRIRHLSADAELKYYEVSVVGGYGSWWLPTAPESDVPPKWLADARGGVEALEAVGLGIPTSIEGQPVVRPAQVYLWVPSGSLERSPVQPGLANGRVIGQFPTVDPGCF